MTRTFRYRAFGLDIASDLSLPELMPAAGQSSSADVTIELATAISVHALIEPDACFHPVGDGGFMMQVAEAGDYWVGGGSMIKVSPLTDADMGMLRLYLNGSAMGMALHQRGALVMHASAVLRGNAVTLFVGDSGAGKSTLAARFGQAGYPVLADDIMPVQFDDAGDATVSPGSISFKLWEDALPALRLQPHDHEQIANRTDKYYVTNTRPPTDRPYPVREIIVLAESPDCDSATLEPLSKLEAIRAISTNTYRPEYIQLLNHEALHFRQCVQLAGTVPVLRLTRPWDAKQIDDTVRFLEAMRERVEADK